MEVKILILAGYSYPELASSSYLGQNRNQAFVDAGFTMDTFTPTPCRGITPEVRAKYCTLPYRHEVKMDGKLTIHRFPMFSEGKNPILRALRYALCGLILIFKGIFDSSAKKCNVLFVPSTPPLQGAVAAIVKLCTRKYFVYNLQDIFPDSLVGTGLAKKGGLLWKIGRVIENFTYKHADKIIVISEDFKKNIMAKGVPEEKIVVVYNWVDEKAIKPVRFEDNSLFEEFNLNRSDFHVVYAGNLGHAQNVRIIIEAAKSMKDIKGLTFVIFGTGGLKEEYQKLIDDYQLNNVKMFPLQPYERVSQVYGLGNVCVVSCQEGLGGSAMPSKTWSIMSAGRAVIASFDEGELKDIIEKNACGVFAKAGDVSAFIDAVYMLFKNKQQCQIYGQNARQFILNNLTREVGTQKYVDVIKDVVKK